MKNASNPSITFVVPCFNVEKYIQQCLDSIYMCNLPENRYEVICVNDCSPDNTQQILELNQKKHENMIIVTHDKNRGLGGARNTGICEAKGAFLWFVDSDDMIVADGLKDVLSKAVEQELDVMCFNYRRIDTFGNELPTKRVFKDSSVKDGESFVKSVFENGIVNHMGYVWRFLYRTEYLRSHRFLFPEVVSWEDTVFMPKALLEADKVASVKEVMYSYRVNKDSISGSFSRVYPAKMIYEYAFCAGHDLLVFSDKVKEKGLGEEFKKTAVRKYINGFPIHLFRSVKTERRTFYSIVKNERAKVKSLKREMNAVARLLLAPVIGPVLADIGALVYGLSHKR